MSNLFINACVRKESRTLEITKKILEEFNNEYEEVNLDEIQLLPLTSKTLLERENLIKNKNYDDSFFNLAKQFANADNIIISAPYWDLGFPAILKIYLEHICIPNITFKYTENGPIGLCKAKKIIYITTAGGQIFVDFGYNYVKALASSLFGIKETVCYKAENLDIECITKEELFKKATITKIR